LKRKRFVSVLGLAAILVIIGFFAWFFAVLFEKEPPSAVLEPQPEFLSGPGKFTLNIADKKRGLRSFQISLQQGSREMKLAEGRFPSQGLLKAEGVHQFKSDFTLDPGALKLAQGEVDLYVRVWDYSRRNGGEGNMTLLRHKMIVDTIPPSIRALSRMHNVSVGGSGLVIYETSSDATKSGVFVDKIFFPGFSAKKHSGNEIFCCYFAVPYDTKSQPKIALWARDRAGNVSQASFPYHIRKKTFRQDKVDITDGFIERILPYFAAFYPFRSEDSNIDKFLKINNALRRENDEAFRQLKEKTSAERLWDGAWLRQKNAANMARFGDHRSYYYKGVKVDEQDHLGIDLASVANSPVQAANRGRVVYADKLGIYGFAVVIDHGQGLASVYGHLSKIDVTPGQEVRRGDIIGSTGETGLAAGDHLHFAMMVSGVFVNPVEWWDGHWMKDNISTKLALVK
jgi:murein DD-endopeptidase MepM/ murein hydrolase activator NlpD